VALERWVIQTGQLASSDPNRSTYPKCQSIYQVYWEPWHRSAKINLVTKIR